MQDLEFSVWQGIVAPRGISQERADAFADACKATVESDRFKTFADKAKANIDYLGAKDFEAFVARRVEVNKQVLKDAGLTE